MKKICYLPALLSALALPAAAQSGAAGASAASYTSSHLTLDSGPGQDDACLPDLLDRGAAQCRGARGLRAAQPVALVGFAAGLAGSGIRLEWATASEKNHAYVNVERSLDGLAFQPIGQVAGYGTGAARRAYFLLDPHVAQYGAATLHYRLRQVRTDGSSAYTSVRTVRVEEPAGLPVSPWFGPATGDGAATWAEQPTTGEPLKAVLTDAAGNRLGEFHPTTKLNGVAYPATTAALPSGVYLMCVTPSGTSQLLKLVRK